MDLAPAFAGHGLYQRSSGAEDSYDAGNIESSFHEHLRLFDSVRRGAILAGKTVSLGVPVDRPASNSLQHAHASPVHFGGRDVGGYGWELLRPLVPGASGCRQA